MRREGSRVCAKVNGVVYLVSFELDYVPTKVLLGMIR